MTNQNDSIATMQPDERRALLAQMLRDKARASKTQHALSYGQRAMWFMYQLAPESAAYNTAFAVRIHSPIDVDALLRVFQKIIDRHEALRTGFVNGPDGAVQEIYGTRDLLVEESDAAGDSEAALRERVHAAYALPCDLSQGDVLRVHLFTRAPDDHVLLLVVHHIAIDGWSLGLILDEFHTLYLAELARTATTLPAVRQYREFVQWQTAMLAGAEGQRLREYWQKQLGGTLPVLNLPTDHVRPQQQSFQGATHEFSLDESLLQQLRALAKIERTTPYVVLLAAFFTLLNRYSDQDDIIVGTPMAARSQPEFQQTVGYMVSPVALRVGLAGNPSFRSLLGRVRQTVLDALSHQDYPFALLVEQLRPPREPGRSPIFDVLFNLQRANRLGKMADMMTSGDGRGMTNSVNLAMQPFPLRQEEGQFDLAFDAVETEASVLVALHYNVDLFAPATVARMVGHFRSILASMLADADQSISALPMLTAAERQQLLVEWNDTARDYPLHRATHELIAEQAARSPDALAATFAGQSMTYGTLDQRANQLAQHLRGLGVGPDVLVGIYLERSLDLLVALLGVLKAGGAYLPLDPAFPRERLAYMLADSAAPVLITQATLADTAPEHTAQLVRIDADWERIASQPNMAPASSTAPESLAYVIYTSGSTGRPKGVEIPQRAMLNFLLSMRDQPGLAANDVLLAVTTLSFDIAVLELFLPLVVGARVALASRETASDGAALAQMLDDAGATVLQATPVSWRLLLAANWHPARPLRALCGGEALPPDLAHELLAIGVELWNMYGPTETTVWSAIQRVEQVDGAVPIGRPIGNTQLYVLNQSQQPQPIGVVGELYIGGAGVACGYFNRPELTAERFVRDPFQPDPAARLYRTGDLARYRPDGTLDVLGRVDHQVKIRGFRIELGEIEAVLREHAGVQEVVVIDGAAPSGGRRLLAYMTAAGERAPSSSDLRRHLRGRLPDYMIPALFVTIDAIPLTPNGKVDRRALPAPERERVASEPKVDAPVTAMQSLIAQVWREALDIAQVGIYDNFFDLGGHSLLAVETLTKIEQQSGIKLNPAAIRTQTLGQIAAMIEDQQREPPPPPVSKEKAALTDRVRGAFRRIVGNRS